MASNGTAHHKLHNLAGWGLIIGLPFVIISATKAIKHGSEGFLSWLSNPIGGLGFLLFAAFAVLYVKLEFDEVVMDYFDRQARRVGLLLNRIAAICVWILMAFAVIKLAFLG